MSAEVVHLTISIFTSGHSARLHLNMGNLNMTSKDLPNCVMRSDVAPGRDVSHGLLDEMQAKYNATFSQELTVFPSDCPYEHSRIYLVSWTDFLRH